LRKKNKVVQYQRKKKSLNQVDRESGINASNSSQSIRKIMVDQLESKGITAPDDSDKERIYEFIPGAPKLARAKTIIFKNKKRDE